MHEWDEKKMDEELEALLHNMPEQDELEKKISQSITKRIRKTVLHTLLGAVIVLVIAFLLVSPLLNYMFFNPYKWNLEPEQKMLGVMRDYCETMYPYREVISLDVKKKGFGRYELEMQVADLTKPLTIGAPNVWLDMNWSMYGNIKDADSMLTQNAGRFTCNDVNKEDLINRISELPKSAMIYLSVSEEAPRSVEELRNLEVELEWFQVYQPNVEFQGGMSYHPRAAYAKDDKRDEMTEQELIEVYKSNLKNMYLLEEAWVGLGLGDSSNNMVYSGISSTLIDTWKDAESLTSLQSENYCVYGKRDGILQFLQENSFDSILVENVSLW